MPDKLVFCGIPQVPRREQLQQPVQDDQAAVPTARSDRAGQLYDEELICFIHEEEARRQLHGYEPRNEPNILEPVAAARQEDRKRPADRNAEVKAY